MLDLKPQTHAAEPSTKPVGYKLLTVVSGVLIFYSLVFAFDAVGIYNWSTKLSVSTSSQQVQKIAEAHWRTVSQFGLDQPKRQLERLFLKAAGSKAFPPPLSYQDFVTQRDLRLAEQARQSERRQKRRAEELALKQQQLAELKTSTSKGPRVLLLGDSIMAGIGPTIKNDIRDQLDGISVIDARVSTGLARNDVFDWLPEVRDLISLARFDYVVMLFGTNDSQDFTDKGEILTYGSDAWIKAYKRRLASLMRITCNHTNRAYWLGLPPMQDPIFQQKIARINRWAEKQTQRFSCMRFVSLETVLGGAEKQFSGYLLVDGKQEKIRASDGIHISGKGGALVSAVILERLVQDQQSLPLAH